MSTLLRIWGVGILLAITATAIGCDEGPDPDRNTPTSGRLVVFVDEAFAPLVQELADSFATKAPSTQITIRPLPARQAVEELINARLADTSATDTSTSYAAVIGREFLEDELAAIEQRKLDRLQFTLAFAGVAAIVPAGSPVKATTLERLEAALRATNRPAGALDSGAGSEALEFIVPNPNSSTWTYVQKELLNGGDLVPPASYRGTVDSVLDAVASGTGIGLVPWYRGIAGADTTRLQALRLGHTDTAGTVYEPIYYVHPSSLVTGWYPLKQPVIGYTFAGINSLANGFLSWLANSQPAQELFAMRDMQPGNMRLQLEVEQ